MTSLGGAEVLVSMTLTTFRTYLPALTPRPWIQRRGAFSTAEQETLTVVERSWIGLRLSFRPRTSWPGNPDIQYSIPKLDATQSALRLSIANAVLRVNKAVDFMGSCATKNKNVGSIATCPILQGAPPLQKIKLNERMIPKSSSIIFKHTIIVLRSHTQELLIYKSRSHSPDGLNESVWRERWSRLFAEFTARIP